MRQLEWSTPFANLDPHSLCVSRATVDDDGWIVEIVELAIRVRSQLTSAESSYDKREDKRALRHWHLAFNDVAGVKVSNESYFDWAGWRHAMKDAPPIAAFVVEGSAWRDEFWNGRQYRPPMVHFAICTANRFVEVLAAYCDIVETVEA